MDWVTLDRIRFGLVTVWLGLIRLGLSQLGWARRGKVALSYVELG